MKNKISKKDISFTNTIQDDKMTHPTQWKAWDVTKIKAMSPSVRARKKYPSSIAVPSELSRARTLSDKTSVWQILSRRRNSSGMSDMSTPRPSSPSSPSVQRDTLPLPSIKKSRLRRLSITAARNSARRRASIQKMPDLLVSSSTSMMDTPPRRLRRLSINAAKRSASRRRRESQPFLPSSDAKMVGTGRLWKKVRHVLLAASMFKRAISSSSSSSSSNRKKSSSSSSTSWASPRFPRPRCNTPSRLAPLSRKAKQRGQRRLKRKTPTKEESTTARSSLPGLSSCIPSLKIDSTSPW